MCELPVQPDDQLFSSQVWSRIVPMSKRVSFSDVVLDNEKSSSASLQSDSLSSARAWLEANIVETSIENTIASESGGLVSYPNVLDIGVIRAFQTLERLS